MQYQFQKIELKDKPVLDVYFNAEEYDNSELCFGNMFLWKDSWHIEFTIKTTFFCSEEDSRRVSGSFSRLS